MKGKQRLTLDLTDERIAASMDGWIDGWKYRKTQSCINTTSNHLRPHSAHTSTLPHATGWTFYIIERGEVNRRMDRRVTTFLSGFNERKNRKWTKDNRWSVQHLYKWIKKRERSDWMQGQIVGVKQCYLCIFGWGKMEGRTIPLVAICALSSTCSHTHTQTHTCRLISSLNNFTDWLQSQQMIQTCWIDLKNILG